MSSNVRHIGMSGRISGPQRGCVYLGGVTHLVFNVKQACRFIPHSAHDQGTQRSGRVLHPQKTGEGVRIPAHIHA